MLSFLWKRSWRLGDRILVRSAAHDWKATIWAVWTVVKTPPPTAPSVSSIVRVLGSFFSGQRTLCRDE